MGEAREGEEVKKRWGKEVGERPRNRKKVKKAKEATN